MSEGLKPCPFHRKEVMPQLTSGLDEGNGNPGSGGWWANVECPECGNGFDDSECPTKEDAIESVSLQWNRRHDRTCENVGSVPKDRSGFYPIPHFTCTECGASYSLTSYANWCPACGAKVVS